MGQAAVWQETDEERAGQPTPPFLTSATTERDLVMEPPPQVLVQVP
jgi:hypothetical protein